MWRRGVIENWRCYICLGASRSLFVDFPANALKNLKINIFEEYNLTDFEPNSKTSCYVIFKFNPSCDPIILCVLNFYLNLLAYYFLFFSFYRD